MRIPGGDISHWQYDDGSTRGDKITKWAQHGVKFLIAKSNEATATDPAWQHHKTMIKRNEHLLVPGAYFWPHKLTNRLTAKDQVDRFLENIGDISGWLLVMDCETTAERNGGVEATVTYEDILELGDELLNASQREQYILYTANWWWNGSPTRKTKSGRIVPTSQLNNPPHPTRTLLWDADYSVGRLNLYSDPLGKKDFEGNAYKINFNKHYGNWPRAAIVQFGSLGITGAKAGGLKSADGDAFAGEITALRAIAGNNGGPNPGTCPTGYHMDNSGICVPDVADCPIGQHHDASGICVPDDSDPDNPSGGTDEPWDGTNDNASTVAYTAGVSTGTGGGLILAGVAAVAATLVYVAWKSGSKSEKVVDRGEKE